MLARYYGSNLARFLSTDPAVKRRKNSHFPQRWNRYAYSLNNPIKYVDPDGLDIINKATDPATFAAGEMLKKSSSVQARFGKGSGRDLVIRNTEFGETIPHPLGGDTTARADITFLKNDQGRIVGVGDATIVSNPNHPETGERLSGTKIFSDVATEAGHAVNAVDNPEAEAQPETPEQHQAAEERGEELIDEAMEAETQEAEKSTPEYGDRTKQR
jgi:hypothetical protein